MKIIDRLINWRLASLRKKRAELLIPLAENTVEVKESQPYPSGRKRTGGKHSLWLSEKDGSLKLEGLESDPLMEIAATIDVPVTTFPKLKKVEDKIDYWTIKERTRMLLARKKNN